MLIVNIINISVIIIDIKYIKIRLFTGFFHAKEKLNKWYDFFQNWLTTEKIWLILLKIQKVAILLITWDALE